LIFKNDDDEMINQNEIQNDKEDSSFCQVMNEEQYPSESDQDPSKSKGESKA